MIDTQRYLTRYAALQRLSRRELVSIAKSTTRTWGEHPPVSAYQIGGGSRGTKADLANAVARLEEEST